jgi:hypothetical protein
MTMTRLPAQHTVAQQQQPPCAVVRVWCMILLSLQLLSRCLLTVEICIWIVVCTHTWNHAQ